MYLFLHLFHQLLNFQIGLFTNCMFHPARITIRCFRKFSEFHTTSPFGKYFFCIPAVKKFCRSPFHTLHLRDMESYVTQETHLFHDSIANNIAIAKPGATREEIMEAAKKASIHDFIMTLPKGYDTEVGELGDTLSGGEKQRIGIARAFLHDAEMILLDEPTSNLDSLNEGIILKSLKESAEKKTVVLVSHRVSTMNVADVVYEIFQTP